MVENSAGDNVQNWQSTDWSVNKKGYRHRTYIKLLTGTNQNEFWVTFRLKSVVELKEIQVGINNFWTVDTEVYCEPTFVLVEAGMTEKNLSLVTSLKIAKDDGFGNHAVSVFGRNLFENHKLNEVQNFRVKYIRLRFRKQVLSCIETSPLAPKCNKPKAIGINFISLMGYNVEKVGNYNQYTVEQQKETSLEILSQFCGGEFASTLKVIANQP